MEFLIAKVKGRQRPNHYKLLSGRSIFQFNINDLSLVDYEPDHNLDEGCWFVIDEFKNRDYCPDFILRELGSADFDMIPHEKYKEIAYLCAMQNDAVCFQKVTPSIYISRKLLRLGENVSVEETGNRLFINNEPDAVYIPSQDKLVFKSLAAISSVFQGIDTLYKEATREEVTGFLDESFISLGGDYNASKVSKPNRKRIALAMETLSALQPDEKLKIIEYIHEYSDNRLTFDLANMSFMINKDDELKYLLYGIEQRFYTTLLGQERRLANSVQTLT